MFVCTIRDLPANVRALIVMVVANTLLVSRILSVMIVNLLNMLYD